MVFLDQRMVLLAHSLMANPTIVNSYHTVCGFHTMLGHSTIGVEFGKPTGAGSFAPWRFWPHLRMGSAWSRNFVGLITAVNLYVPSHES